MYHWSKGAGQGDYRVALRCWANPYFEDLVKNANRVFYFNKGPRVDVWGIAKANIWVKEEQETCLRSSRKIHKVALAQGQPPVFSARSDRWSR